VTLTLIFLFFGICLFLGFLAGRKKTDEGFFIADRNLGTFTSTATITASFVGANTLLVYTAFVFMYGISAFWTFIGYLGGFYIFGLFGVHLKKRADVKKYFTLSDYFQDKHGNKLAILATFAVFIVYFGALVNQYIGGAKMLAEISGWSYITALILTASVIMVYLFIGGFNAVVKTDAFQYVLIIILPLVLIFSLTSGITVPISHFNFWEAGYVNILAFLFYGLFSVFIYAELWQRAYAAKDEKTVRKAFNFAGISYIIIGLFFTYIGLVARSVFPNADPDMAAVYSFTQLIPSSILVITLILLFAVIMSSADTILFVLAMNISQDVLNRRRKLNKKKELLYTKISIIAFSVIAVLIAILYPKMADIVIVYVSIGIGLAPLIIISWLSTKVNVQAMIITYLATVLTILILVLGFGIIHPKLGFIAIVESFVLYYILFRIPLLNKEKN